MSKKQKSTIAERISQFKTVFVPTGEIVSVKVKYCAWNVLLKNKTVSVIQIDYDSFLSVDYQNENTPWIKYILLKDNIEIIKKIQ